MHTFIFGAAIHADNAAHLVGFLVGGAAGLACPPERLRRRTRIGAGSLALAAVGAGLAIVTVFLALRPPVAGAAPPMTADVGGDEAGQALMATWRRCALREAGQHVSEDASIEETCRTYATLRASCARLAAGDTDGVEAEELAFTRALCAQLPGVPSP